MGTTRISNSSTAVATLGIPGDIAAPAGTREWAIAMRLELQAAIHNTESDAARLARLRLLMEQHHGYAQLLTEDGRPFESYRAFCETKQPWGLGYAPLDLDRLIKERTTAQMRAQEAKTLLNSGPPTKEECMDIPNNVRVSTHGNSADYLTARIARDRPDIHERMKAGEFPSVRAAALEAGIVKPTMTVPADPDGAIAALVKRFGYEVVAAAIKEIVK